MLEKMRSYISEQLGCDPSEITPETDLKEDLGADSLDLFELIMNLEEEYAIDIPQDDLEGMKKISDVMDYLKAHGIED
ncbi:MAG: acyl carrier protein [Lachnospiraceae bacterium]|nr:acyl carrier protein [Lachnospiraceae bacterium]